MIVKLRITSNPEFASHGCEKPETNCCLPGGGAFKIWERDYKGQEVDIFLPPVPASKLFKCGSKLMWKLAESNNYVCVHQLEMD